MVKEKKIKWRTLIKLGSIPELEESFDLTGKLTFKEKISNLVNKIKLTKTKNIKRNDTFKKTLFQDSIDIAFDIMEDYIIDGHTVEFPGGYLNFHIRDVSGTPIKNKKYHLEAKGQVFMIKAGLSKYYHSSILKKGWRDMILLHKANARETKMSNLHKYIEENNIQYEKTKPWTT